MQAFLWLSSSLIMLALLLCLAVRALREVFCLPLCRLPGSPHPEKIHPYTGRRLHPVLIFLLSLVTLWAAALLSYLIMGDHAPLRDFPAYLYRRMTEAGDAPRYIFMAENGYVSDGEYVNNIVFYPLYPLLMAIVSRLFALPTAIAGMLISQLCYGLASVFLYRLAACECQRPELALLSFLLYPFGFFCLGVFTEGLFLLLTVLGLYFIRKRQWLAAGIAAFFCTLTRTQGILLLLPAVYEAVAFTREQGWKWRCLAVLSPVAAYFIYLCINKAVCGDFFAYQYYESIEPWWQTPQWLGATLAQQWGMIQAHPGIAKWIYWPQLFLYFIAAALLFCGFRRRLPTAYLLYGTAYLGMCYTASWLISGGRYMLGCLPLYFCVARLKGKSSQKIILILQLAFLLLFCRWFMQGQCIM